jgi:chemosensory pili system protein ChpB (putative protein-glutamate methylesterase)
MSDGTLRVALLARAGDACNRIGAALHDAGAEVVLVADPTDAGEDAIRDARPQAIMVALEPAIEDALDGFDGVLSDPAYLVIFEEAELAAQRAGWDAARWVRHLAAKLHRHADVLPPGADDDADLQPSPGPLPRHAEVADIDQAIAAFTDEAQQHADDVPRDAGIEGLAGSAPASHVRFDPVAFETSELSLADDAAPAPLDPAMSGIADAPVDDADSAGLAPEPARLDFSALSLVEEAADGDVGTGASVADGSLADADPMVEAVPGDDPADAFGGLALADDEAPAVARPGPADAGTTIDLQEQRFSGLSLADPESYGHGPERGVVLVDAGLGGPDAVRQLLGALPAGFPRPVLVRLQLDGGRYDRLVRQMERAAALPVQLATADAEAAAGHVYLLPPELGLRRDRGRLLFDADAAGQLLPDALPPADCAVLLLSGATRRMADAVAAAEWSAALVAGQSPDGSYDPDASLALLERGGLAGTPVELAAMLAQRWPPPGAPAPDFEEPQA